MIQNQDWGTPGHPSKIYPLPLPAWFHIIMQQCPIMGVLLLIMSGLPTCLMWRLHISVQQTHTHCTIIPPCKFTFSSFYYRHFFISCLHRSLSVLLQWKRMKFSHLIHISIVLPLHIVIPYFHPFFLPCSDTYMVFTLLLITPYENITCLHAHNTTQPFHQCYVTPHSLHLYHEHYLFHVYTEPIDSSPPPPLQ